MAKIDLRHTYRSVRNHKSNFLATGLPWQCSGQPNSTYFFYTQLPFCAKSSPEIIHRLTQSVRLMVSHGFQAVVVYLDDFLIIGKSKEECQESFSVLLKLLQDLHFQISWRKVIGTTQKLYKSNWACCLKEQCQAVYMEESCPWQEGYLLLRAIFSRAFS